MPIGPIQLLVVGFDEPVFDGKIMAEIQRLRENDAIRLIDVVVVNKDADGNITRARTSGLDAEEGAEFGAVVGALIGLGVGGTGGAEEGAEIGAEIGATGEFLPEDIWYVEDVIGDSQAAAVALIEHRWAIGLREAIQGAGGFHLADAWVHPLDLVGIGLIGAEEGSQQIFSHS